MPPLLCRLGVSHDVVIMSHWPAASLCLVCFVCSPCLDQEALPREASALRQTASGYCAVVAGICHCGDFVQRYFHFLRSRGKRRLTTTNRRTPGLSIAAATATNKQQEQANTSMKAVHTGSDLFIKATQ